MNDLPQDPPRLRAILKHLDAALAENQTVHLYLDIQRNNVVDALRKAEGTATRPELAPSPAPASGLTRRAGRPSEPFKIGRVRTLSGPVPSSVHVADCSMAGQFAFAVNAEDARLAITDANLEVCAICRPDTELGVDMD
ncbi:DUF6233 domain-containing protein [Streptomyces mirabilis]|uniref:DUF6233 domain-containing protein n=1 Tax=Streptomyces mirabilis TaxID=68239 RepID=UPI0036604732